jgi:hypothetical protein
MSRGRWSNLCYLGINVTHAAPRLHWYKEDLRTAGQLLEAKTETGKAML